MHPAERPDARWGMEKAKLRQRETRVSLSRELLAGSWRAGVRASHWPPQCGGGASPEGHQPVCRGAACAAGTSARAVLRCAAVWAVPPRCSQVPEQQRAPAPSAAFHCASPGGPLGRAGPSCWVLCLGCLAPSQQADSGHVTCPKGTGRTTALSPGNRLPTQGA